MIVEAKKIHRKIESEIYFEEKTSLRHYLVISYSGQMCLINRFLFTTPMIDSNILLIEYLEVHFDWIDMTKINKFAKIEVKYIYYICT